MSLTPETIEYLEEILESRMHSGEPFTSVDIANEAKAAGYFVRNRWVAEWLRSNAIRVAHSIGALYNQSLINVNSKLDGPIMAYLYHPMDFDPDDYVTRSLNPTSPYQRTPAPSVASGSFGTQGGGIHIQNVKDLGSVLNRVIVSATFDDEDIEVEEDTSKSTVDSQHDIATGRTKPRVKIQQRDKYGRFTKNPDGPVNPPNYLKQKRDDKGRFKKEDKTS